jgi:hypothetical protein
MQLSLMPAPDFEVGFLNLVELILQSVQLKP